MDEKLLKNKKIFLITGTMGIGKTVFANKLVKQLKDKTNVFDDFAYLLEKSSNKFEPLFEFKKAITAIRHTGENVIVISYYHSRDIDTVIRQMELEGKVAWIFLSIDARDFYRYPIVVPSIIVNKFNNKLKISLTKKRKTRPYLIVTKEGYKIGRYKK